MKNRPGPGVVDKALGDEYEVSTKTNLLFIKGR